jgi:hypothetical protein
LLAVRPEGRTDKPKAGKVRQEARRDYCLTLKLCVVAA